MTLDMAVMDRIVAQAVRSAAELPDRTSPDHWPEAMLVTGDELAEIVGKAIVSALVATARDARQRVIADWVVRCWGQQVLESPAERGGRLFEESAEAAQACGLPQDKATHILAYVYGRPPGNPAQEIGGVGVTLLALATSLQLSADDCEQQEVARVLAKPVEHFRTRHAEKEAAGVMVTTQEHAP